MNEINTSPPPTAEPPLKGKPKKKPPDDFVGWNFYALIAPIQNSRANKSERIIKAEDKTISKIFSQSISLRAMATICIEIEAALQMIIISGIKIIKKMEMKAETV